MKKKTTITITLEFEHEEVNRQGILIASMIEESIDELLDRGLVQDEFSDYWSLVLGGEKPECINAACSMETGDLTCALCDAMAEVENEESAS